MAVGVSRSLILTFFAFSSFAFYTHFRIIPFSHFIQVLFYYFLAAACFIVIAWLSSEDLWGNGKH